VRYLSVCSGIEAATVAWHPLGWTAAAYSEIEAFPRAVLSHHYPDTPLHGDFTTIGADEYGPVDLLVGGTPCQSFSVAGLRGGLGDDRGNLALEYLRLADRTRPRWLVWENVPGVLSSNGGRDFGAILGGMVELGYQWSYRVLDAQYAGVPQRRRRVFVVGYLGDWRASAAVLFERHSLSGDTPPRRKAGQEVAGTFTSRANSGGWGTDVDLAAGGYMRPITSTGETAHCLNAGGMGRQDFETETLVTVGTLTSNGDAHSGFKDEAGLVPVAFAQNSRDELREMEVVGALSAEPGMKQTSYIRQGLGVRRLTPLECERLQGFPDDYTLIPYRGKPAADGPRYKALGNSMAVPVMRWIGERISLVQAIEAQRAGTTKIGPVHESAVAKPCTQRRAA
jgi:DNA (cytosine-5)-methyltransferase 1